MASLEYDICIKKLSLSSQYCQSDDLEQAVIKLRLSTPPQEEPDESETSAPMSISNDLLIAYNGNSWTNTHHKAIEITQENNTIKQQGTGASTMQCLSPKPWAISKEQDKNKICELLLDLLMLHTAGENKAKPTVSSFAQRDHKSSCCKRDCKDQVKHVQ